MISGNQLAGIRLGSGAGLQSPSGYSITGNRIGTDATGTAALPNAIGIEIVSVSGVVIGGSDDADRNVISGNNGAGILVRGDVLPATGTVIQHNFIGLNASGTDAIANAHGVELISTAASITDNVISGNFQDGIRITAGGGSAVAGNIIGLDASGTLVVGNLQSGITTTGSANNILGGSFFDERNIIAGNGDYGIAITGTSSTGNIISGNFIGTDITGTLDRGNALGGVSVSGGVNSLRIGSNLDDNDDLSEGNLISGNNGDAIAILNSSNVTIGSNTIGAGLYGLGSIPNLGDGISLENLTNATIGGLAASQHNTIVNNTGRGILVSGTNAGVNLRGNEIYNNALLGIDFGTDGVTLNDAGDVDGVQNYPVLDAALAGAQTQITGTLTSQASATIQLDFYASLSPDPLVYGEGQRYIGSASVTTDAIGAVAFDITIFEPTFAGEYISATATNAANNASEFSGTIQATSNAPPTIVQDSLIVTIVPTDDDEESFGIPTLTVNEGDTFYLTGDFADADSSAAVSIIWGDGTTTGADVIRTESFTTTKVFLDDDPSETPSDVYPVVVRVTDTDGSGSAFLPITVLNVDPVVDESAGLSANIVNEGDSVTLSGGFVDPGTADYHFLQVDWGDGAGNQTIAIPRGERTLSLTHAYRDNGDYVVRYSLFDDDRDPFLPQPGDIDFTYAHSVPLQVLNAAPAATIYAPTFAVTGDVVSVSAFVVDPGQSDTIRYEWLVSRNGVGVFSSTLPTFQFTPQRNGDHIISLVVSDDDAGSSTASHTLAVSNAPPQIRTQDVTIRSAGVTTRTIDEGSEIVLSGMFLDSSASDIHTVVIDFGDGSTPRVIPVEFGDRIFADVRHTYVDDPAGPNDEYLIQVSVSDEISSSSAIVPLKVLNVAPEVSIRSDRLTNNTVRLEATIDDVGLADTHTVEWFIDDVQVAGGRLLSVPRPTSGPLEVRFRAIDDDGDAGQVEAMYFVLDDTNNNVHVMTGTDGTVAVDIDGEMTAVEALDEIMFALGAGNDVISIDSTVTANVQVDGGLGNDMIVSGGGNDVLVGGAGADTLIAGAGDDTLVSDEGNDELDGGSGDDTYFFEHFSDKTLLDSEGIDTLNFARVAQGTGIVNGISIDLGISDGTRQQVHSTGTIALSGVYENVVGSTYRDKLVGNSAANLLFGGVGDDSIEGSGGQDTILGGDGDDSVMGSSSGGDTIDGGTGDDTILGGTGGNDSIFGGPGDDSIQGSGGDDTINAGDGNDSVQAGSGGSQSISGGDGDDTILGGLGSNDTLIGGTGDDSIIGGGIDETVLGGDGDDTISGGGAGASISAGTGNDSIFGSSGGNDTLFGGPGDDSITGSGGEDTIDGGDGADSIVGSSGGTDSIVGGDGNDTITAGGGTNTVDGGTGDDSISGSSGSDTISGGEGDDTIIGGGAGGDSIDAGSGDDTILSGTGNDTLFGGPGDDSIDGSGGQDTILGGSGDDTVVGGTGGNGSIDGGSGDDSILAGSGDGDTVLGGDGNDTITGTGGQDTILGGIGDDSIMGGNGGSDSIDGGSGSDTIVSGSGSNDTLFGGPGDDSLVGSGGQDTIDGGDGGDTIIGSGGGSESLSGGSGDDTIISGAGNGDTLFGGPGDDSLQGSGGSDSIDGGVGEDTIVGSSGGTETLVGGGGDDSIISGGGNDTLEGGDGSDTLVGSGGGDSVSGGSGNDSIFGGAGGLETLNGGDGNDTIIGGSGANDSIFGGPGDDSIEGSGGTDTILGNDGDDTIIGGNGGDESIDGGGGDDSIEGGGGDDDTLVGGTGDDTATGGDGTDSIDGGSGDDSISGGSGGGDSLFGGDGDDIFIVEGDSNEIHGGSQASDPLSRDRVLIVADADFALESIPSTNRAILRRNGTAVATFFDINVAVLRGGASNNVLDATDFLGDAILIGGAGDDTLLGGNGNDSLFGGAGNDSLHGGTGNDTFVFEGAADLGTDVIDETGGADSDTLDFYGLSAPVKVDLSQMGLQTVSPGLVTINLSFAEAIENVVGTLYADKLRGNDRNNTLVGGGDLDFVYGGAGDDYLSASRTRYVVLDFDSKTSATDHVYTTAERDGIQARMEADFAGFDVVVSQTPLNQIYTTVRFNDRPVVNGVPVSGGVSEGIGFRDTIRGGIVKVDVNGFLGTGTNKLPPNEANFIALSSTIASHELGHMFGLRHLDAFGAPGQGIFNKLPPSLLLPTYQGPRDATETADHLIASPASVRTTLSDALQDPYFGERESIKLAFADTGQSIVEQPLEAKTESVVVSGTSFPVQSIGTLPSLNVPNNITSSAIHFGVSFDVAAINLVGQIELAGDHSESDFYSFTANAGDVMTFELMSYSLRTRYPNQLDSILRVYSSSGVKLPYYTSPLGAFNDDGFEPTDSILLDLPIPSDGTYYVEVDTFNFGIPEFAIYKPSFNVAAFCSASENLTHIACTDKDTGSYELLIYRFGTGTSDAIGDTIVGGGGIDTLVGSSGRDNFFADGDDVFAGPNGGRTIQVNTPPTLQAIPAQTVDERSPLHLAAIGSDSDFGDEIRYRLLPAGSPAVFPTGATLDAVTGQFDWTPPTDGVYHAIVEVSDLHDVIATQPLVIHVNDLDGPQPPTALDDSYDILKGKVLRVTTVLANDVIPVDTPVTSISFTKPSVGKLAFNKATGLFAYQPIASFVGDVSFTYTVTTAFGSSTANVVIHVLPVNAAPIAVSDQYAYVPGQTLNVLANGVLGNDTDSNSDDLTAELVSGASSGALSLHTDGSFTYVPNPGFNGTDSFTYRAKDATATSANAVVKLSVLPSIESVQVNGDSTLVQRSMVDSIVILFSTEVTITGSAFEVRRIAGTNLDEGTLGLIDLVTPEVSILDGKTKVVLRFSGADSLSLQDGRYSVTVLSQQIHAASGGAELDGDGDGNTGGNRVDEFFRLFGDQDRDGDVDTRDYAAFNRSLQGGMSGYLSHFDFNGDGEINNTDKTEIFARRNKVKISQP